MTTATETRPLMALINGKHVRVRNVQTETAFYLPDENGTFQTVSRRDANREPSRAVRVVTVTTKFAEDVDGSRYRIDQYATARDVETLQAFTSETAFREPVQWSTTQVAFSVVRYL